LAPKKVLEAESLANEGLQEIRLNQLISVPIPHAPEMPRRAATTARDCLLLITSPILRHRGMANSTKADAQLISIKTMAMPAKKICLRRI
jgi:hypothetical protein